MPARDPPIAFEAKGEWYDGEIRRFVRLDNENPPARGGVVFVGSSIFREWREARDFAADLAPLPVVNRAFGGSTARDQLRDDIMEAIVFPHEPRVLVYYCGSNDLNEGESPRRIRDAFISWSEKKKPLWDALDETNRLIKEYCETHDDESVVFADVNPLLFEDGDAMTVPNVSLFRDDGLHFDPDPNARAYEAWVPTVRDAVFRAWDRAIEWEKRAEPGRRDAAGEGEGDAGEDPYLPPRARR